MRLASLPTVHAKPKNGATCTISVEPRFFFKPVLGSVKGGSSPAFLNSKRINHAAFLSMPLASAAPVRYSRHMDDILNPYTGHISIPGIMERIRQGETTFPHGMGETVRPPQTSPIEPPKPLPGWVTGRNDIRPA